MTHILVFNGVRYLAMVEVALVINTMPLFTAVMGYFLLDERLHRIEVISLIISFVGIAILVTGKHTGHEEPEQKRSKQEFTALLILMIVPVLIAAGNIAVRTLRGMNLHAISIYFSLS